MILTSKTIHLLTMLLSVPFIAGCPITTKQFSEPIPETKLSLISPNKTTKYELIDKFGPPLAIAAEANEILTLPAPTAFIGMDFPRNVYGFYYQVQSKPFFELFLDKHVINKYHRVYFFQHYQNKGSWFLGHQMWKTLSDNLWVLVNEQNGLIEDYFFISKGKK